ncbi:hypothetical protein GQ457_07G012740 [Hibiscus cannabinus]
MKSSLVSLFTSKKIKDVVFGMNGNKAPGPDEYPTKFFQISFGVVREDFIKAMQYFFKSCSPPFAFNSIIFTLVPKVHVPSQAVDFRLIACCNTVYKCITTILANRMK